MSVGHSVSSQFWSCKFAWFLQEPLGLVAVFDGVLRRKTVLPGYLSLYLEHKFVLACSGTHVPLAEPLLVDQLNRQVLYARLTVCIAYDSQSYRDYVENRQTRC